MDYRDGVEDDLLQPWQTLPVGSTGRVSAQLDALFRAESRRIYVTLVRLLGDLDLDEAIRLAAGIPPARVGCIEVRPTRPIRETVAGPGVLGRASPEGGRGQGD